MLFPHPYRPCKGSDVEVKDMFFSPFDSCTMCTQLLNLKRNDLLFCSSGDFTPWCKGDCHASERREVNVSVKITEEL